MLIRIILFATFLSSFSTAAAAKDYVCRESECVSRKYTYNCSQFPLSGQYIPCMSTGRYCKYEILAVDKASGESQVVGIESEQGKCTEKIDELVRQDGSQLSKACMGQDGQWTCVSFNQGAQSLGIATNVMMDVAMAEAQVACVEEAINKGLSDDLARYFCPVPTHHECQFVPTSSAKK